MPLRSARRSTHALKAAGRFDGHRLVGAKGGQHADRKRLVGRDAAVMFQRVDRVVGRANQHHLHLPHDAAGGELGPGELRVGTAARSSGRLGPSSRSLMPSGRFNSRCVQ